jgi:Phage integrase family
LRVALRVWRRQQRRAWLKVGRPFPDWVFASVTGTALDEANVRKAFNRILDAAELDRRGPHQMRHTFASLLLQDGAPLIYFSRQLGHKDASSESLVDVLDATAPHGPQTAPRAFDDSDRKVRSALDGVVNCAGIKPVLRWMHSVSSVVSITPRKSPCVYLTPGRRPASPWFTS